MRVDGGEWRELDLTLLCVGNGRYFGAGMCACPNAIIDDGSFDTLLLAGFGRTMLVRALARVYKGRHLGFGGIEDGRAKQVELEADDPADEVLIDLDGEQPGRLPLRLEIQPTALRVQIA
jgi:diacylglycerol kinase family enzyme